MSRKNRHKLNPHIEVTSREDLIFQLNSLSRKYNAIVEVANKTENSRQEEVKTVERFKKNQANLLYLIEGHKKAENDMRLGWGRANDRLFAYNKLSWWEKIVSALYNLNV